VGEMYGKIWTARQLHTFHRTWPEGKWIWKALVGKRIHKTREHCSRHLS